MDTPEHEHEHDKTEDVERPGFRYHEPDEAMSEQESAELDSLVEQAGE